MTSFPILHILANVLHPFTFLFALELLKSPNFNYLKLTIKSARFCAHPFNSLTIYFDKIYFHSSAFLIKTKPYCGGGLNFRSFFAFLNSHF